MRNSQPRWRAVATYRSAAGPVDVTHEIEELDALHDLIERGPDWNALIDVLITLARPTYEGITLEEAEAIGQMTGDQLDAWCASREVSQ